LLLETGATILREEGLGVQTSVLTFKHVFERLADDTGIRTTNASVIGRIWDSQSDYQADVMVALATDLTMSRVADVGEVVTKMLDGVDLSSPASRQQALTDVCRVAAETHGALLRHSETWTMWMTLWTLATASNLADRQDRVLTALLDGYVAVNAHTEAMFEAFLAFLGFRMRAGLTVRHLMIASGAMAEGCALRDRVDADMLGIPLATGPGGEEQEWSIYGLGLHAIAASFVEDDPSIAPDGDA